VNAEEKVCGELRSARENLCRAQTADRGLSREDIDLLSTAINRIDLVGMNLPGWSKRDRPNALWDLNADTDGGML
jgi:hypothetical protein